MSQTANKSIVESDNKLIPYLFLTLLIVFAFMIGFTKISDHDVWWHLKTGEIIVTGGIPHTDIFSFTAFGSKWVTHEWLAEVVLYLIYKIGGLAILNIFTAWIAALVGILIFNFGNRRGAPYYFSAAIALYTVAGLSYMLYPRPHAFGFIFLVLLISILFETSSNAKRRKLERWLILPVILWIWANMHAGFILGLGIYWVVATREFILPDSKGENSGSRFKGSIAPAIFATLLCLINPNGIEIFLYPFQISMTSTFKSSISEWVSPLYLGGGEWLAQLLFYLANVLGIWAAILHIKKRPDISLIIIVAAIMAWLARRNIQNYAIILAIGILAAPTVYQFEKRKLPGLARKAAIVLSALWMIAWFGLIHDYQKDRGSLGIGIKKGTVPVGPAGFLNLVGFEGNIVNILADGGYLIWTGYPRWKVFVDGRLDVYGEGQIKNYRLVVEGAQGALDLLDEIDVDAAVLPMPPLLGLLRNLLAVNDRWALVFMDDYYLVYMKRDQKNNDIINQWAYNEINPLASGFGYDNRSDPAVYETEAMRNLSLNPESGLANSICGYFNMNKGRYEPAIDFYKKALLLRPDHKDLYRTIGETYTNAGNFDSAMVWFNQARKINPADPQVYIDIGYLYARQNDWAKAQYYLGEAIKRDPNGPAKQFLEKLRAGRQGRR